jgi:hypothetical protein
MHAWTLLSPAVGSGLRLREKVLEQCALTNECATSRIPAGELVPMPTSPPDVICSLFVPAVEIATASVPGEKNPESVPESLKYIEGAAALPFSTGTVLNSPSSCRIVIHALFALFLSFNNPVCRISPPLVGIHGCWLSRATVVADDCGKLNIKITSYSSTSAVGNYKISLRAHWGSLNAFAISYRRPQKVSIDRSVAGIKESHLKARAGAIGDAEVVAAVHVLSHDANARPAGV